MERGSVSRSTSATIDPWKMSATKVTAKRLRVTDPRSAKINKPRGLLHAARMIQKVLVADAKVQR